ncbi:glycoside hydrolase family 65 protein [Isachenkonia alkalipeptolytica]|uniref:Glycoside hydrolase family 65 protein n=1 Tax=Isachenkonia alkalipeptolytica TaxID=2565777 RepID=A0AA44BEJ2_9CLOT|nr:glycoside hydrolase family 65 protein [Isachenkonia alkalipeptolytica]NBG88245.1 glycoside hydrolase family 65 protein [Isachenkonia alkalipeptolytica]
MTSGTGNFGQDPWVIREDRYGKEDLRLVETLFSIGNGTLGMRGNLEEGPGETNTQSIQGTYMNGFYDSIPIVYGEGAYGYAKSNETMLNLPDAQGIRLILGGEVFSLEEGTLLHYERGLYMMEGMVKRLIRWQSPRGREVEIHIKRIIPFEEKGLAMIDYQVTPLNFSGEVGIRSTLDPSVFNKSHNEDPRIGAGMEGSLLVPEDTSVEGERMQAVHRTRFNRYTLWTEVRHQSNILEKTVNPAIDEEGLMTVELSGVCREKEAFRVLKIITYHHCKTDEKAGLELLKKESEKTQRKAVKWGFNKYENNQREYLKDFWEKVYVRIEGAGHLEQGMNFNLFHLLQSLGKDGKTAIAAKGLTGEGYNGHYFWDTEIYVFPVFLYTKPELARNLLMYRYQTLDRARDRAREMNHKKGALYPWRTIDGSESSAYYPAGTAQYHINGDIIYALKKYVEATGDEEFLRDYGLEMVLETARIWMDLGHFNKRGKGKFEIYNVTGPDEYTALVNNNFFTNSMAKMHLNYACDSAVGFEDQDAEAYYALMKRIAMDKEELKGFQRAADKMKLIKDEALGVYPQDDSFLDKPPWDFEQEPKEKKPLLLHYHPLNIYRHQVLKQGDVVLGLFLLSEEYSLEDKKRNYDYYEPLTTHDSSLSYCIHSIMASEAGYGDEAQTFFRKTVRMDLDNVLKKSHHGIHTANMGGAWMTMVFGFGGMRTDKEKLSFRPVLPGGWEGYSFRILFRGAGLEVMVGKKETLYTLLRGDSIEFKHNSRDYRLDQRQGSLRLPMTNN